MTWRVLTLLNYDRAIFSRYWIVIEFLRNTGGIHVRIRLGCIFPPKEFLSPDFGGYNKRLRFKALRLSLDDPNPKLAGPAQRRCLALAMIHSIAIEEVPE